MNSPIRKVNGVDYCKVTMVDLFSYPNNVRSPAPSAILEPAVAASPAHSASISPVAAGVQVPRSYESSASASPAPLRLLSPKTVAQLRAAGHNLVAAETTAILAAQRRQNLILGAGVFAAVSVAVASVVGFGLTGIMVGAIVGGVVGVVAAAILVQRWFAGFHQHVAKVQELRVFTEAVNEPVMTPETVARIYTMDVVAGRAATPKKRLTKTLHASMNASERLVAR